MPSHRDVGGRDFENTVTVPGPMIRSRHVETEAVEPDDREGTALHDPDPLNDDVRCPTCGRWLPGIADRCPDDDTPLRPAASDDDA